MVFVCTLLAVVLGVSTYAWFIGMKTVKVSSFDVKIATTEGLFLSMDGENWSYTLDAKNTAAYETNTNTWATTGLIPLSTVGDMDTQASRMKLYEKGSLTTTTGGYRLLTSRVQNFHVKDGVYEQGKGYVAFDSFIKNLSGTEYYVDNEPANEEAIYLTTNSAVKVAADGIENTGIENSVRVAFAQIGRVQATTETVADITGITCTDKNKEENATGTPVTGICRSAQIWEPNDESHVENAISWYNTSCLPRTGATVTDRASYTTTEGAKCATVENGTAYSTYAISRALEIKDNVDVYDGTAYNGYGTNVSSYADYVAADETTRATLKLVDFPYFTDTMKVKKGTQRPEFMTLAPNSITKVRVYVFIEGQDIDNYDFASLGAKVLINFGFTKERYTETDIGYDGPSTDITNVTEEASE